MKWLPVAVILMVGASALASSERPNDRQSVAVYFENDLFADTDRYYTNGVRVSWLSPDIESLELPRWAKEVLDEVPLFYHRGYTNNVGLAFGQSIFTPQDIFTSQPVDDDRPYAGWLYGSVALHHKSDREMHKLELTLGLLGPESLAEAAQNGVHEFRNLETAEGWDHQLHTEPGLIVGYEYKRLVRRELGRDWWTGDLIPAVRVHAGNVLTALSVGVTGRIGYNVPRDFHGNRIGVSGYTMPNRVDQAVSARRFSVFAFLGLDGNGVARNVFLDGNSFRDSHRVDREPWTAEIEAGIGMRYRDWHMAMANVWRSREFREQDGLQEYGSISLSWAF